MKKNISGITFIELLVAISVIMTFATSLFMIRVKFIKSFQKIYTTSIDKEKLSHVYKSLYYDIISCFAISQNKSRQEYPFRSFTGKSDYLRFVTGNMRGEGPYGNNEGKKSVYTVEYVLQKGDDLNVRYTLLRRVFPLFACKNNPSNEFVLFKDISGIAFLFFDGRMWGDVWEKNELPCAVKINIELDSVPQSQKKQFVIPIFCGRTH
ncbi:type II secretion system protein GspJ [Chlamydiota bacterium]